jgi:hypothetical protein
MIRFVKAKSSDTLLDLKAAVTLCPHLLYCPGDEFFCRGALGELDELEEGSTLRDYNIQNLGMLILRQGERKGKRTRSCRFNTYVMQDSKITAIEVEPSDTIHSLKIKIQDKEGIPTGLQRLIFDGPEGQQPLEEDRQTVGDYNIRDPSLNDRVRETDSEYF